MPAPVLFFDIAGPDEDRLQAFYSTLFGWSIGTDGRFEVAILSRLSAAIRRDPAEKRLYLGVDDVAQTLSAIEAAGGSVDAQRFEVKGMVVLGLFRDPAGNPMGLVEIEDGELKIP